MFEPKIKIDRDLYERGQAIAKQAGYSSIDEFVVHLLEQVAGPSVRPPTTVERPTVHAGGH